MIPRPYITAWRGTVPWAENNQVEQDLVLSRAVVEIFSDEALCDQLILRGGTAFHKLILSSPARYSEDVDLVQRDSGPIGDILDSIRHRLDHWLGPPRRNRGLDSVTITYRFDSETLPAKLLRLKIEINTREHFALLALQEQRFVVRNPWFRGEVVVPVYQVNELFGTKLRALYQRKKGRDLFDLWLALHRGLLDPKSVVECFLRYIDEGGTSISRAQFEANLADKAGDQRFHGDVRPLLATGVNYDPEVAFEMVQRDLIAKLPGDSWKGAETTRT